jgi:glycerophosphoryl diester phosphodiesterase
LFVPLLLAILMTAFAAAGPRTVVVISHRGEHLRHPENTLAALRAAIEAGADYLEVDVRTTADGKLVLMHDPTVDRTTGGTGRISGMTLKQVKALSTGRERVPTFEEALSLARGKAQVCVDCKDVAPEALIAALEHQKMIEGVVVYGNTGFLREVQTLRPAVRVMPEAVSAVVVTAIIKQLKPKVIAFSERDWQDSILDIARRSGAELFVDRLGPADHPAAWQDAIGRGATGIQTDHPAELVQYLRSKGLHK